MNFPSNWLIATNGSKYASEAVRYASELSAQLSIKPEVTILVVALDEENEHTALAIIELARFLFEQHSGPQIEPRLEVRIGEPGPTIVETAKELNCDQILIGGADFKWDINDESPGGISNFIIEHFRGIITVIK